MKHTIKITRANCSCHGVEAYLETDSNPVVWVCQIDDKVCEVQT